VAQRPGPAHLREDPLHGLHGQGEAQGLRGEMMPTDLRCDSDYLRRLIVLAVKMHRPLTLKTATMLADVRDYLMYLTLDGLGDPSLARALIDRFSHLQSWLEARPNYDPRSYIGFIRNRTFCSLSFASTWVRLWLLLDADDTGGSPRFIASPQGNSGTVNLRSVDDVNDELIGWIKKAYDKG